MAPIGSSAPRETGRETIERARARASLIPDLLVEAQRVANTVYSGWHGRRKRGIGENFWQFRQYSPGENMSRIDWRRSARDESNIYVQDKEWQATHTVWLWVDESPSMLFKSDAATVAKQSRALVLAFAMAELLARSGERVGWLGVTRPILSRNAAERLAEALILAEPQIQFPINPDLGPHSDLILFSDFLDPIETNAERLQNLFKRGARGHVVQIVDPVEEVFPYSGRVEFSDPETGEKFTAGNAETLKQDYETEIATRTEAMRQNTASMNWSFIRHHTD
ncbi:MAG: DUF58 domain-containing protein, partial [Rhizobiaceae bacterium]|nr:DUF58 domain-containing protein [Rhizobiaceae bacterium]